MVEETTGRSGGLPAWGWPALVLLLLVFFLAMSASGDLLAPYLGRLAGATDYLHEFAHDGRHLLGVPLSLGGAG